MLINISGKKKVMRNRREIDEYSSQIFSEDSEENDGGDCGWTLVYTIKSAERVTYPIYPTLNKAQMRLSENLQKSEITYHWIGKDIAVEYYGRIIAVIFRVAQW